ncbi:hypothetical protein T06_4209, partial [Trichinella sp. T6]
LWIGWIESFVGQFRSLVNSVRWSSEVSIGTLEKIRFGDVKCGKLLHYKRNTKTQYTDVTKDQYCVIS